MKSGGGSDPEQSYEDYKKKVTEMVMRETRDLRAVLEAQSLNALDKTELKKSVISLLLESL
jgi:hypothetical protein